MDGDGFQTAGDTIEASRKRQREDDDGDTGGTGGQPPGDFDSGIGGGGADDAFDDSSPSPPPGGSTPSTVPPQSYPPVFTPVTTVELLLDNFEPLIAAIICDNHANNHFTRLDQTNQAAAMTWKALPTNQGAGGIIHAWSQAIADLVNLGSHAIEFSGIAVRRDLVGDGYHDSTGERLWTESQYSHLYSHPEYNNKSQVDAHKAAVLNLRNVLKNDVDAAELITAYQAKLDYLVSKKNLYAGYVVYAQETFMALTRRQI